MGRGHPIAPIPQSTMCAPIRMLITFVVALSSAALAFTPPALSPPHHYMSPMHAVRIDMGMEHFEPKRLLAEIRHRIDEQKALLAECKDEEECMLKDALLMEQHIAAGDSMTVRVNAAKQYSLLMATVAQAREHASQARRALESLDDQKRSAIATLWDLRLASRHSSDMSMQA